MQGGLPNDIEKVGQNGEWSILLLKYLGLLRVDEKGNCFLEGIPKKSTMAMYPRSPNNLIIYIIAK